MWMRTSFKSLQLRVGVAFFLMMLETLLSCKANNKMSNSSTTEFYKIGHRGTRGLMPENTITSMLKAIEVGANTIEFDVHVTKDKKVIVYHDESFNPDYTTMPDGSNIKAQDRKKYTFYQMEYKDIKPFVIGMKPYSPYPQQQRIATYTPLLTELIDSVEAFTKAKGLPRVKYLIEVKSKENTDGIEQPSPEEFMKIMMAELMPLKLGNRMIVQSFDMRPLKVLHAKYPSMALGFLTGDAKPTFEENINLLGFTPAFYNPHYGLVDQSLVQKCHSKGIKITPWTVNTIAEMKKIKQLNVDGIITDYPNMLKELE
jgi:glycerophosphoryl diester phosphodiesterase